MTQQESLAHILLRMFLTWSKSYTTIFYIKVFEGQGASKIKKLSITPTPSK